jgi:hypothetical protein
VHLNIGWPAEEHNPLLLRLVQFEDTVPPTIPRGGVRVFDESGRLLKERAKGRLIVRGRVQIVVDAWDQVDGNETRRLGLFSLGYEVLGGDGAAAAGSAPPRPSLVFNRLAMAPDAPRLVFAPGSGIPFYGRRATRFLYIVTNTLRDGVAAAGVWDTRDLAPGPYTVRIHAATCAATKPWRTETERHGRAVRAAISAGVVSTFHLRSIARRGASAGR